MIFGANAAAEEIYYTQNQTGFTLPGVTLPQGQDEVRAADGTTCRSAVAGSGAYLDVGVIQGNGPTYGSSVSDLSTYGRIVIPLGRQPKRLDCARLYQLEVERLQMELRLLKMGLDPQGKGPDMATNAGWAEQGWSDKAGK
ncbi:hypothetical protein [Neomesorhizobium albiziae]|nr:hypothetical protein [Mesorhizobium albiziae]GLS29846.1 hypothetical protein GCM10007937_15540 [Mesorhizobium albiziae]